MAEVITRLNEVVSVLRRLPEGSRYEHPYLTSWPDIKSDPNTAYGYEDVKVKPPIPSPAAIQRMEEVLTWLQLVPAEYRRMAVAEVGSSLWLWQASGQAALAGWGGWFLGKVVTSSI